MQLKNRLAVLKNGAGLLKSKREAIIRDFFELAEECVELRAALDSRLADAAYSFHLTKALAGDAVNSAAFASKRDISIDIKARNIWGINVPEIEEKAFVRNIEARDMSVAGESPVTLKTAKDFEKTADAIVKTASCEIRLKSAGEEIKMDTRRINALDELLIPRVKNSIRNIERVLEQREREDVYRLKRFKAQRLKSNSALQRKRIVPLIN